MKQLLLATALIAVPVAAFTGFNLYTPAAGASSRAAGLGDLSALTAIVSDVQTIATRDDLAAAKTRIRDFEIAWDENETGLKPLDPEKWGLIDDAADAALTALRSGTPDPAAVRDTLAALQATLATASRVTK